MRIDEDEEEDVPSKTNIVVDLFTNLNREEARTKARTKTKTRKYP